MADSVNDSDTHILNDKEFTLILSTFTSEESYAVLSTHVDVCMHVACFWSACVNTYMYVYMYVYIICVMVLAYLLVQTPNNERIKFVHFHMICF